MNKDLTAVYQDLLLGDLGILEEKRKVFVASFLKVLWIFVALTVASVIPFFIGGAEELALLFIPLGVVIVTAGIVLGIKQWRFTKPFKIEFKAKVIPALVKSVDDRLNYDAHHGLMNEYWDSGLFPRSVDRHRAEDTITAQFDQTRFSFGEIHTEYKTVSRDKNGNRQEHWHTIFEGLFFVGDFNKHFSGETIIDQDTMERMFGKLGRKFQSWNTERKGALIRMDNPAFEKGFAIYSTDEQECRYLLTPSLMERILELNERTGKKICLSFRNKNVYVAYSFDKNLFEPRIFRTSLKIEEAQLLIELIDLMSGLVEDLNLNTRIWTKE